MEAFTYTANPHRVVFGFGTLASVAGEVEALRCRRAIVLSTSSQAAAVARLAEWLGPFVSGTFAGAVMHTPVEVTEHALTAVRAQDADCLISLGGGSTIGLGKALALRTGLPQIAVPTTYSGSEATPILGETAVGQKVVQRNLKILPAVIVYDVELTLSLPIGLSITSGINAIAHAAEALYARERNPVTSMMAGAGIAALARSLSAIAMAPEDHSVRADALYGAWLCGTCLGAVGMGLHHKLCHVLGGSFGLPHAETHTVVLPHVLAYNRQAAPEAMDQIARAMGVEDAPTGLHALTMGLGAPSSLAALGMTEQAIPKAATIAAGEPCWNPQPIEEGSLRILLERAYAGLPPESPQLTKKD